MFKKMLLVAAALVAVLSTSLAEAAPRERSVAISRGRVAPHALRVESGTKVTWRNMDSVARTVVIDEYIGKDGKKVDPKIASAALAKYDRATRAPVAAFSHVFVDAGTYRYKLAGTSSVYTVVVDSPKAAPSKTATPVASATAKPGASTTTPTPTPSPTPRPGSATSALASCADWTATRVGTSLTLRAECELSSPAYVVQLRPRLSRGDLLLVDRVVTRSGGAAAQVITAVPVELTVNAGTYREVVVMPDQVRVPVEGAATQPQGSPTATATPKPVGPAPIATVAPWPPGELPSPFKGLCGGWKAERTSVASVQLTGECIFPSGGHTVRISPRDLGGSALLIDKLITEPTGPAATVVETVPVSLRLAAGPERRDVVLMPDRVRVPIVNAPTATPTTSPTATALAP